MATFEKMDLDHEAYFITDDAEENAKIWNRVCQSEFFGDELSTFLKEVTYGTRSYTSIDAYQQIRKATEVFGPFGKGWGVEEVHKFAEVPVVKMKDGSPVNGTQLVIMVKFFYIDPEGPKNEKFYATILEDIFMDASGDSGKKMLTGAITKFLSYLGFNFDVFCGRFDGAKVAGSKSKDTDIAELKRLAVEILGDEKGNKVIDYHTRRDFRKADVAADLEKLRAAAKEKKEDANAEAKNG